MKIILALAVFIAASYASDLFEGDIVLDDETRKEMSGASGYDGIVNRHWPNGVVPYVFDSRFSSSSRRAVERAIEDYKRNTCIKFVPRTNEAGYVRFYAGGGCSSMIGRTGRKQDISLGRGCTSHGTVVHEMMHAIGFYHEQSRLDRDQYVTINWQNIQRGMDFNFKKYNHGVADYFGEAYDYGSVMHYGKTAFGGGRVTIQAKGNPNQQLGQRNGFSAVDLRQINRMYKCGTNPNPNPNPITNGPPPPPTGCKDISRNCRKYANPRSCQSNSYIRAKCQKSCRQC